MHTLFVYRPTTQEETKINSHQRTESLTADAIDSVVYLFGYFPRQYGGSLGFRETAHAQKNSREQYLWTWCQTFPEISAW